MKYLLALFAMLLLVSCGAEEENSAEETVPEPPVDTLSAVGETDIDSTTEEILDDEFDGCSIEITAALYDPDPSGKTNIRKSPGGELAMVLDKADDEYGEYFLHIIDQQDGWFKLNGKIEAMERDYEIPGGEGWIHGSLCHFGTRNYGGSELQLYSEADEGSDVVQRFDGEWGLTLEGVCGEWAKVRGEFDGKIVVGWIQTEWLCGNPVTNCS